MPILKFKDDVNSKDLEQLKPATWILLSVVVLYCERWDLPLKITSLISDRENVKAVSTTHETGRAFDISVKGWTEKHIHRFCYFVNLNYTEIAAISSSDGKKRAAVFHNNHIHLQVKPNANVKRFI